MKLMLLMVVIWWRLDGLGADTPYHYISQVSESAPETLSPKALLPPRDLRRGSNGNRGLYSNRFNDERDYRYGTKRIDYKGVEGEHNLVYADYAPSTYGTNLWYPVYSTSDPTWGGLNQSPLVLTYGVMPEGYEPKVPLRGDPTGYTFNYQAGDHSRHESSDGRGNYFSSFSFVPPPGYSGLRTSGVLSSIDQAVFPGLSSSPVNVPLSPSVYPSAVPPTIQSSTTPRPLFTPSPSPSSSRFNPSRLPVSRTYTSPAPTSRTFRPSTISPVSQTFDSSPLHGVSIGSHPDSIYEEYPNGYYFESKRLNTHTTRIPQNSYSAINHALSTNIQYDSSTAGSTPKPNVVRTGERRVTIISTGSTTSAPSSTEGSYQTLSRSLPLAFTSRKLSTVVPSIQSAHSTERTHTTSIPRRRLVGRNRSNDDLIRSASRRSTTERPVYYSSSTVAATLYPTVSPKTLSVIQKIPRKSKSAVESNRNETETIAQRPAYIDDLTHLAYSPDKTNRMNSTIIQFKTSKDKSLQNVKQYDSGEKFSIHDKSSTGSIQVKNSNRNPDMVSKDGYITGNKTFLGGLGLWSNIHY